MISYKAKKGKFVRISVAPGESVCSKTYPRAARALMRFNAKHALQKPGGFETREIPRGATVGNGKE